MRKVVIIIVLVLLNTSLLLSQKCKPRYVEKDDFTEVKTEYWGNTLTSMSVYSYGVQYAPQMFVFKDKGEDKIVFFLGLRNKLDQSMLINDHKWFEKGSKIILKLENDFLEFIVEKSTIINSGLTKTEIVAPISREQIEKMNSQVMEKARIYPFIDNEDMIFQFSIIKGRDKKIKQQLACFLKL